MGHDSTRLMGNMEIYTTFLSLRRSGCRGRWRALKLGGFNAVRHIKMIHLTP